MLDEGLFSLKHFAQHFLSLVNFETFNWESKIAIQNKAEHLGQQFWNAKLRFKVFNYDLVRE